MIYLCILIKYIIDKRSGVIIHVFILQSVNHGLKFMSNVSKVSKKNSIHSFLHGAQHDKEKAGKMVINLLVEFMHKALLLIPLFTRSRQTSNL